jgi:sugar phosphate permease
LGIAEAGFLPGVVYYLSLWFTPNERAFRMALFLSSVNVAGAVSGLAAYGLLQLDGRGGLQGWQWLFLIEGIPSVVFGILTYFVLPAGPAVVTWLTEEEKNFALSRVANSLREANHSSISGNQIKFVLTDVRVWIGSFLYTCHAVAIYSVSFFLPAIIGQFGFSDIVSNLLTVPAHTAAVIAVILNGVHSDKTNERYYHIMLPQAAALVCWGFVAYSLETDNIALQYTMIIFATFTSCCSAPVAIIWPMDFMVGSTAAAIAPAMIVGIGNLGGIIGPQIFGLSMTLGNTYTWGALCVAFFSFLAVVLSTTQWILLKKSSSKEEDYLLPSQKNGQSVPSEKSG